MKKQCTGSENECCQCGKYYASHSPHYEKVNGVLREVVTIGCCYGTGGIFDANTRERLKSW